MKYNSKSRRSKNKKGSELCEICKEPHYLQAHHIEGRKIKNADKPSNLIDICSNCHEKIHRGDIIIEGKFLTSNGLETFWHKKSEESFSGIKKETYIK